MHKRNLYKTFCVLLPEEFHNNRAESVKFCSDLIEQVAAVGSTYSWPKNCSLPTSSAVAQMSFISDKVMRHGVADLYVDLRYSTNYDTPRILFGSRGCSGFDLGQRELFKAYEADPDYFATAESCLRNIDNLHLADWEGFITPSHTPSIATAYLLAKEAIESEDSDKFRLFLKALDVSAFAMVEPTFTKNLSELDEVRACSNQLPGDRFRQLNEDRAAIASVLHKVTANAGLELYVEVGMSMKNQPILKSLLPSDLDIQRAYPPSIPPEPFPTKDNPLSLERW